MNIDFDPPADPWTLFADWYALATQKESAYPDAMTLATVGADGMPSARTVLMKHFDSEGFVFYTNRLSRKGTQLAGHPQAALCFYWKSVQRQVHVEGLVRPVSDDESAAYFATRPRGSQIGAWASLQSQRLDKRETLEQRVSAFEAQYPDGIPRPPHWGGYRLTPRAIEFWQERTFRLHDRVAYKRHDATWINERYYP